MSTDKDKSGPDGYVLHKVEHYQQRYNWDCGVSCVLMLLPADQRVLVLDRFQEVCAEEGFIRSTWTIDLCYLLKRFGISHHMCTTTLGVNEAYRRQGYYANIIDLDRDRVKSRFEQASSNGISVSEEAISMDRVIEHVREHGPAILLVDAGLLVCDLCKHNKLKAEFRRCFGGGYKGHYILVVGHRGTRLVYRDPALHARLCAASPGALHRARAAPGTDLDCILASSMSKRTVVNEVVKGLVETVSIPAEVHEQDGRRYASSGSTLPIHCCTEVQVKQLAPKTHHYCGIFSERLLAPLGELAYVRIDETTAEKVFINRTKRLLLTSSDGVLAQWRCAPTFESANTYLAGTPLVNQRGELVTVVTARRGNHYALSNFEGEGGYFESPLAWQEVSLEAGQVAYGARTFTTREQAREYIASLPPIQVSPESPAQPAVHRGGSARVALVAAGGRQIAHTYLQGVLSTHIQYL